jgi:hypothetical protein
MTDAVSADADPVSDYAGSRLQSVIDHRREQVAKGYRAPAGRVEPRPIAVVSDEFMMTESVSDHGNPVIDH